MPYKPARPCYKYPCPNLTTDSTGYCDEHKAQQLKDNDAMRESSKERGYDKHWRRIRVDHLKTNPLCVHCQSDGRVRAAVLVHHIDRDSSNNQATNLVSLCNDCHEKEHKKTRYGNDRRG